ncbi:reverse transcriptase [Plakobranchus ocellatus]|uniref:Reverse transcriptase n=1 Tax=Plakobranchus ocellatus TaxID=259542 RepID=A0AAV4CYE3_9GAST|nr:reverse transcriptase [Plakobranchus ocellatus]
MIWEAIQRAKSEKLNLDVVWLDLANAYGSVPHEMIQLALRMHHVPDDYFSEFCMRFSTNEYTTKWINLEVGIAMGCTISPILFVMAMEVILKAAEGSAGPANLGGGCSMPPLKAFMDNTTIICSKEDETRRMLTRLDVLMSWYRMEFKPKKSRSLSIRKGKVDETTTFTVAEQHIPTVSQEPVKSFGRWYDSSR